MRRLWNLLFSFTMLLFMVCPAAAAASVPKPVMQAKESVVRVLAEYPDGYATGSGFVVMSDSVQTILVTNYHVVEGQPHSISVWIGEEETISAGIVAFSDQKDLCILRLEAPISLKALSLSDTGAKQGDGVYAVGFPSAADVLSDKEAHTGKDATITDGIVSAVREVTLTMHGTPAAVLQISAAINPGNSGGPLFNKKGEVVGINTYGIEDSQGIYCAIDVCEIRDFLKDSGIRVSVKPVWLILIIAAGGILLVLAGLLVVKGNGTISGMWKNKTVLTVVILLLCVSLMCGGGAFVFAQAGQFTAAEKLLLLSPVTRLCVPKLTAYVQAGQHMENRNFGQASQLFSGLSGFLKAEDLARESSCGYALQRADANDFDTAVEILRDLNKEEYPAAEETLLSVQYRQGCYLLYEQADYKEASKVLNGLISQDYPPARNMKEEIEYMWAMSLVEQGQLTEAYRKLKSIQDYADVTEYMEVLSERIYMDGQHLYGKGKYSEAKEYFNCVRPYSDSKKYLTLIEARNAFWSDPEESVKELLEIFSFEDAAKVLLCRKELAEVFLRGTWRGYGQYFTMDSEGNIQYSLPDIDYGDYYTIQDGVVQFYPKNRESAAKPVFGLTAISPESMKVYCYSDRRSYTLYLQ